jgi:4,5-DOPA dioxygenase extradiol
VVASGNITHNSRDWQIAAATGGQTPAYAPRFAEWVHTQLQANALDTLLNYRQHSAEGRQAHPSEDHLMPLFVALGAAGEGAKPQAFYRGVNDYVISMDGYAFTN